VSREARNPVFKTIAISVVFAGSAIVVWAVAPETLPRTHWSLVALAFAASLGAVVTGRAIHLGPAWLVLMAIATPSLVLVLVYRPPIWLFPLAALLLAGFYSNGALEKVPLYLTNTRTRRQLADLLPKANGTKPIFIDLGCGLGGVVSAVARARPDADVIGVETAPLSFILAWLRLTLFGPRNARIRFQSIWHTDVSQADTVYAFLSPAPMARLNEKLRAEMKAGSIFISNSFAVPGAAPDTIIPIDDSRQTQLLIWQM